MSRTIRIGEALWESASRSRRADWLITIAELVEDGDLAHERISLTVVDAGVGFHLAGERGEEQHVVATEVLGGLVGEYLHVIRRMQDEETSESSAKMQALDMAKKVVHDKGATALASALPGVAASHEAYRRLFTLVLSLLVDVTALPGARAHRRHAALR